MAVVSTRVGDDVVDILTAAGLSPGTMARHFLEREARVLRVRAQLQRLKALRFTSPLNSTELIRQIRDEE